MPNYNDESVNIPLPVPTFVFPEPSNFYEAGAEREEALREFIFICRYSKNDLDFPHAELYDDLWRYLIYTDADFSSTGNPDNFVTATNVAIPTPNGPTSTQNKSDVLPVLKFPLKLDECKVPTNRIGRIAEGCAIFAMFYLCRQLGFSTIYDRANFDSIFPTFNINNNTVRRNLLFRKASNSNKRTIALDPYTNKPSIYKALHSALMYDPNTGIGYTQPSNSNEYVTFNSLLDIVLEIGKYSQDVSNIDTILSNDDPTTYFEPFDNPPALSLIPSFYIQMYRGNTTGSPSGKRYTLSGTTPSDKIEQRKKILAEIHDIFKNKIFKIGQEAINYETKCLYKELYPTAKLPNTAFIATGDGSITTGLLGVAQLGAIFFSYELIEADGERLARVSASKKLSLTRFGNSVAHIKTFGAEGTPYTATTILFKKATDNESYLFNINSSTVTLGGVSSVSTDVDPVDSNQILIMKPVASPVAGGPQKITIGRWNNASKDLEFFDTNDFQFDLTQVSGVSSGDNDEVQSLICVVPDPSPFPVFISADDLYRNDKFEMPKARIDTLFTSVKDEEAVKELFRLIVSGNATIQIKHLYGNFVGKSVTVIVPDRAKIVPDTNYLPHTSTTTKEDAIDPPLYDLLRYSFAVIDVDYTNCNAPIITIEIDSYVSPRFSDLKGRMINTDTNGFNFDYRNDAIPSGSGLPNTSPPNGSDLETNYTNGYVINNPPGVPSGIKSYNQPLAVLRSMGLLEGIFYRLKRMAATQYVSNVSAYNMILSELTSNLTTAVAEDRTAESRSLTATSTPTIANVKLPSTITYAQYHAFKWYALKAIKRIGPLGPAGPGDSTTIPPTPYEINGQQVYEYFQYLHEIW